MGLQVGWQVERFKGTILLGVVVWGAGLIIVLGGLAKGAEDLTEVGIGCLVTAAGQALIAMGRYFGSSMPRSIPPSRLPSLDT